MSSLALTPSASTSHLEKAWSDNTAVSQPWVSVIIVSYNNCSHLQACFHSLLEANDAEVELILIDNHSSDGSPDYVAEHFPTVKVIRNEDNHGFGRANNQGAQLAQGEYLAFLNPDTAVTPGWLEKLIVVLESDETIGLVTPKILLLDQPKMINTAGNDVHLTGLTLCRGMGLSYEALAEPAAVGAVSGAAFVIRRDLFVKLGGFDAAFFMYFEDTDLSLRARLLGYECRYVPEAVIYHDYQLRFGPQKTYFEERNRYVSLLKIYRWLTLLLLLPVWFLGEVVTWGFILIWDRQNLTNKFWAYVWIIQHWQEIKANRQQMQGLRKINDKELIASCEHRLDFEQTASGLISKLAHIVFNPLFYIGRKMTLWMIWW